MPNAKCRMPDAKSSFSIGNRQSTQTLHLFAPMFNHGKPFDCIRGWAYTPSFWHIYDSLRISPSMAAGSTSQSYGLDQLPAAIWPTGTAIQLINRLGAVGPTQRLIRKEMLDLFESEYSGGGGYCLRCSRPLRRTEAQKHRAIFSDSREVLVDVSVRHLAPPAVLCKQFYAPSIVYHKRKVAVGIPLALEIRCS